VREREARAAAAAEEAGGGAELVIDISNTLLNAGGVTQTLGSARASKKRKSATSQDDAAAAEPAAGDDATGDAQALAGFDLGGGDDNQQELINRAFATGDDEAEFRKAKAALVEANLPVVPETLQTGPPGWGSWMGAGVEAKPLSAFKKRKLDMLREQVERERQAALQKRKDAKLPDVIISEKRDKKVANVQLASLPYPYTSESHMLSLMSAPLGADWNSQRQHQRLVHPPVITKPGQVIAPMKQTAEIEKRASEILSKRSLSAQRTHSKQKK
jgi:U3 small nucleolar RNA-associated protein 14